MGVPPPPSPPGFWMYAYQGCSLAWKMKSQAKPKANQSQAKPKAKQSQPNLTKFGTSYILFSKMRAEIYKEATGAPIGDSLVV